MGKRRTPNTWIHNTRGVDISSESRDAERVEPHIEYIRTDDIIDEETMKKIGVWKKRD